MLLKTLRDIYFVYNRNLSTDTTFSKNNWTEILFQHLPILGHIFIKNKQTNKHILYLPLLITGHVFIKTKTNKQKYKSKR